MAQALLRKGYQRTVSRSIDATNGLDKPGSR
jgi:hypothetical protein